MAQSEKGCALFILREGKIKMRLDKFLKVSRLIKRRTVANEACDAGRVLINGAVAKASTKVKMWFEIVPAADPRHIYQILFIQ